MGFQAHSGGPQSLPSIIDRARARLAEARTSGELLEARKIAQAALHYAKVTSAANETHADCLRIIVLAEMRMADAIDEGQANGEIRTQADNQHVQAPDKLASLEEIGVARQRLADFRRLRNAGLAAVDAAIDAQLAEGKAPTKSGIITLLAGLTGNCEWYTPTEWVERAREVMGGIDLDPASTAHAQRTVKAGSWFDKEHDGLNQRWHGNVWLDPPYGRGLIEPFIKKLICERPNYRQAVVLTHNATDADWFHDLCSSAATALAFTRGRINFGGSSPITGSAITYIGHNVERFRAVFGKTCLVITLTP